MVVRQAALPGSSIMPALRMLFAPGRQAVLFGWSVPAHQAVLVGWSVPDRQAALYGWSVPAHQAVLLGSSGPAHQAGPVGLSGAVSAAFHWLPALTCLGTAPGRVARVGSRSLPALVCVEAPPGLFMRSACRWLPALACLGMVPGSAVRAGSRSLPLLVCIGKSPGLFMRSASVSQVSPPAFLAGYTSSSAFTRHRGQLVVSLVWRGLRPLARQASSVMQAASRSQGEPQQPAVPRVGAPVRLVVSTSPVGQAALLRIGPSTGYAWSLGRGG
ncbi:hypothetical protein [Actinoplanes sp. NPDC049599]|uniref:hypothetical protein n=1 Tax=Actinoplanes sp. NPDC049599 TaxID=3363903 RepID=UPI0037BD6A54